jgi:uncharacterized protein (DUF1015 family)
MAGVRPFRALRYDEPRPARSSARRAAVRRDLARASGASYLARSPYNVVHLTLPDSEEQAARDLAAWRERRRPRATSRAGVLGLAQDYVGPDGVARTRNGLVVSLRSSRTRTASCCRTSARTRAEGGRLRLLRATRTQLEPIFLLYDGAPVDAPVARARPRGRGGGGDAALALDAPRRFADAQLLIADGHHRYETALAFHDEDGPRRARG